MTRLWLIRHARPLIDPGRCYGALDVPADAADTQQAAHRLAQQLPIGLMLRCSTRQRCTQLASALTALRPDLHHQLDPRLTEMDFGQWEGQRWDQLGAPALKAWSDDFARHAPGGGESVESFMRRVGSAWDEHRDSSTPAAWITHAGVIRAVGLLSRGLRCPHRADQWPVKAPGFGEWQETPLP